jgi:hypothetical protein
VLPSASMSPPLAVEVASAAANVGRVGGLQAPRWDPPSSPRREGRGGEG